MVRMKGAAIKIVAEAVENANPLDHSIPDFFLHQSNQKHR